MADWGEFPDAEKIASREVRRLTEMRCYSSLPKRAPIALPICVIQRIGGLPLWKRWIDNPRLQVDTYGRTRAAAHDAARAARLALMSLEGGVTVEAVITDVSDDLALFYNPDTTSQGKVRDRYTFGITMVLHPKVNA